MKFGGGFRLLEVDNGGEFGGFGREVGFVALIFGNGFVVIGQLIVQAGGLDSLSEGDDAEQGDAQNDRHRIRHGPKFDIFVESHLIAITCPTSSRTLLTCKSSVTGVNIKLRSSGSSSTRSP